LGGSGLNDRALPRIVAVAVSLLAAACGGRATLGTSSVGAGSGGTKSTGGSAGATGGAPRDAAAPIPGDAQGGAGAGGAGTGGTGTAGAANDAGNGGTIDAGATGGVMGTGGATSNPQGPCDIYRDAGQPCVAAYSTVRRLLSTYAGPLYQIRTGSSNQNTGSGGVTLDVGQTADGFADAAAVDAACEGTICTVSVLYDQSGKASDLRVAKAGVMRVGPDGALDDFESSATTEPLTVGGHKVYPLYMERRQGYRLARLGDGLPRRMDPQGIYMLADGTRAGPGCCWDFGNGPPDAFGFYDTSALNYGTGSLAVGVGDGPWFRADLSADLWAGASRAQDASSLPNPNNPSLRVKFALGLLKAQASASTINMTDWALRMADVATAGALTTAYRGVIAWPIINAGSVILGIDGDNSNYGSGTFYEGAILAGFPADDTELSVLRNIQAVRYGN
jgi:non-reducing end alpha-L-arabinofuranosidase